MTCNKFFDEAGCNALFEASGENRGLPILIGGRCRCPPTRTPTSHAVGRHYPSMTAIIRCGGHRVSPLGGASRSPEIIFFRHAPHPIESNNAGCAQSQTG